MIEGHGDDCYKFSNDIKINFSSNIYNHAEQRELYDHLSHKLPLIHSYPPPIPYELENKIADDANIDSKEVSVTNGATEAIYLIAQLFANKCSTILEPTFSEYADACRLHHHKIEFIYRLDENARLGNVVWICNPNNPTGEVFDKDLLIRIISKNPKTYFVIDQSYENFTLKPLLSEKEAIAFDNLILIHSMTKQFAIPGLRVGYISANKDIVHEFTLHKMPWSVNVIAIEAAKYLIENKNRYLMEIASIMIERERVHDRLKEIYGVVPWSSDTNFMLVQLRSGNSSSLKEYLVKEHSMLIRDASNFHGLDSHFFRIAVQSAEENNQLIKAIEEWMSLY